MPRIFDDVAECVENTLSRVGSRIVLALPSGVGKPNPLANGLECPETRQEWFWQRLLVRELSDIA